MLVVNYYEVKTGVGAHLDDRWAGQAVEYATQALAAAQHGRQARVQGVIDRHK